MLRDVGWLLLVAFAFMCGALPLERQPETSVGQSGLVEGDIALPEHLNLTEDVAAAYLNDETALWPLAVVPYRFHYQEGYPVFSDIEIERIEEALSKITMGVPCLRFRCLSFHTKTKIREAPP